MPGKIQRGRIRPIAALLVGAFALLAVGCDGEGWTSDTQLEVSERSPHVLTWPPAGPDVVRYRLELDGNLHEEFGSDTRRRALRDLREGTEPVVRLIALGGDGSELGVLERRVSIADETAPQFASNAAITLTGGSFDEATVRVAWPPATDLVGVDRYELTVGDASWTAAEPGQSVPTPAPGTDPRYAVRARDAAGNASEPLSVGWSETELGRAQNAEARRALQDRAAEEAEQMAAHEALGEALRAAENTAGQVPESRSRAASRNAILAPPH